MRRYVAVAIVITACTTTPMSIGDGGASDADLRDTGPIDMGLDAAPPPGPRWCGLCHTDAECGGGLCLSLRGGAEHACGALCNTDADCTALSSGAGLAARCMIEAPGLPMQCRPTSGSCITSAPGAACPMSGCTGTYDVCLSFDRGASVCTSRCSTDADCPIGMHHCASRGVGQTFCQPDRSYDRSLCASPTSAGPPPICACASESATSITGQLLASAGLSACDLRFTQVDAFGPAVAHDRFRLAFTDRIRSYAPEVPRFGHAVAASLDMAAAAPLPVTEMLTHDATLADLVPVRPNVPSRVIDLVAEVTALATTAGATPDATYVQNSLGSLDAALQASVAPIVRATRLALVARETALTGLDAPTRAEAFDLGTSVFLPSVGLSPSFNDTTVQGLLLGDVRTDVIAQAAIDLSATIETYSLASFASTTVSFAIDTPAGSIVFSGSSADVHMNRETLLLIDFGGNDTYRGSTGANASATNGVSVVIDVAGVDDYDYVAVPVTADTSGPADSRRLPSDGHGRATPTSMSGPYSQSIVSRQGAGRLGVGLLFDFGTDNDHYRSLRMSQGYGALGVGALYDEGGDDTYEGEAAVQGAASFGIGVLFDRAGNDHYVAYAFAQGFGYTRGVGTLYDLVGTDDYFSHPTDVLYFSPQNPGGSNSSFSQGAGFGRRAPGPMAHDDVNMSGGLGVLRDAAGDDRYTVGIFGQGAGYWFGTGLLLEGAGADRYDGWWYVHGSAAHFAVGALLDDAGGDTYQCANPGDPARNTSVGVGHDFSLGWLVDRAGDDIVHAPNLSLGSGNAAGFGFFVDLAGNDTYTATSDFSFGDASIKTPGDAARAMSPGTIGLFVDRGGTDSYTRPTMTPIAANTMWTQQLHPMMGEHGVGADAASGTVGLGLD